MQGGGENSEACRQQADGRRPKPPGKEAADWPPGSRPERVRKKSEPAAAISAPPKSQVGRRGVTASRGVVAGSRERAGREKKEGRGAKEKAKAGPRASGPRGKEERGPRPWGQGQVDVQGHGAKHRKEATGPRRVTLSKVAFPSTLTAPCYTLCGRMIWGMRE